MQNDILLDNVMQTINVINGFIKRNGNIKVIENYYKKHGTYDGLVEYLSNIEEDEESDNDWKNSNRLFKKAIIPCKNWENCYIC